ncbi:hypothetical protein V5799_029436 [Amblyomma americanum]|uniref:Uncharacterized protein n=1 Tax=Amblyomma americanum TaxID=6943 RepID=A0AAQ4ERG1_AMBAM
MMISAVECPRTPHLKSPHGVKRPVGCFCNGNTSHPLPAKTLCYEPHTWEGEKWGTNQFLCFVGECNPYGECRNIFEREVCETERAPK